MSQHVEHPWLRLLAWYAAYRDDEWEHHHGIKLIPLEHKPGWSLIIDTGGTELAGITMVEQRVARSDTDWLQWSFEPDGFRATGGERNVPDMIDKLFEELERLAEVFRQTSQQEPKHDT